MLKKLLIGVLVATSFMALGTTKQASAATSCYWNAVVIENYYSGKKAYCRYGGAGELKIAVQCKYPTGYYTRYGVWAPMNGGVSQASCGTGYWTGVVAVYYR